MGASLLSHWSSALILKKKERSKHPFHWRQGWEAGQGLSVDGTFISKSSTQAGFTF